MLCSQFNYKLHWKQSLALKNITLLVSVAQDKKVTFVLEILEMIKWKFLSGGVAPCCDAGYCQPGLCLIIFRPRYAGSCRASHVCSAPWDILYQIPSLVCPLCSDLWPDGGCSRHHAAWDSIGDMSVSRNSCKTDSTSNLSPLESPPTLYQHCWGYLETWKWE